VLVRTRLALRQHRKRGFLRRHDLEDLARIRAFYADKTGLHPALAGKIRLRDDI